MASSHPSKLYYGLGILGLFGIFGGATRESNEDRVLYWMIVVGSFVVAAANVWRHRSNGRVVTWQNVTRGAWLGAVGLPVGLASLLHNSPEAIGEIFGSSLIIGGLFALGLGSICAGQIVDKMNAVPTSPPQRRANVASPTVAEKRYTSREERDCPLCAERILSRARICKHCHQSVEPVSD